MSEPGLSLCPHGTLDPGLRYPGLATPATPRKGARHRGAVQPQSSASRHRALCDEQPCSAETRSTRATGRGGAVSRSAPDHQWPDGPTDARANANGARWPPRRPAGAALEPTRRPPPMAERDRPCSRLAQAAARPRPTSRECSAVVRAFHGRRSRGGEPAVEAHRRGPRVQYSGDMSTTRATHLLGILFALWTAGVASAAAGDARLVTARTAPRPWRSSPRAPTSTRRVRTARPRSSGRRTGTTWSS